MKKTVNSLYSFYVWLTTSFAFPSLYILYRLLDWEKTAFSFLGVFYLLLTAVIIGGLLSLPSCLLSKVVHRRHPGKMASSRTVRLLTAVVSILTMFILLAAINYLFYPLHQNFWLVGICYAVCVTLSCFVFDPLETPVDVLHGNEARQSDSIDLPALDHYFCQPR